MFFVLKKASVVCKRWGWWKDSYLHMQSRSVKNTPDEIQLMILDFTARRLRCERYCGRDPDVDLDLPTGCVGLRFLLSRLRRPLDANSASSWSSGAIPTLSTSSPVSLLLLGPTLSRQFALVTEGSGLRVCSRGLKGSELVDRVGMTTGDGGAEGSVDGASVELWEFAFVCEPPFTALVDRPRYGRFNRVEGSVGILIVNLGVFGRSESLLLPVPFPPSLLLPSPTSLEAWRPRPTIIDCTFFLRFLTLLGTRPYSESGS